MEISFPSLCLGLPVTPHRNEESPYGPFVNFAAWLQTYKPKDLKNRERVGTFVRLLNKKPTNPSLCPPHRDIKTISNAQNTSPLFSAQRFEAGLVGGAFGFPGGAYFYRSVDPGT